MAQQLALDSIKLIRNGPKIHGEHDLFPFIEYYDNIYALNIPQQLIPITIITLKTKIKSKARQIIDVNPQCTLWNEIKTCLVANLANLSSLTTLTDQLLTIRNDSSTLDFYQKLHSQDAKIMNKYRMDNPNATREEITAQSNIFRRIVLRLFRGKLREPFRSLITTRNPATMEEALLILRESSYNLNDAPQRQQTHRNSNNFNRNFSNRNINDPNYYTNNYSNSGIFRNNMNQNNNFRNMNQGFYQNNHSSRQNNSVMSRIRRYGAPEPMDVDQNSCQQQNFHFSASKNKDPPRNFPSSNYRRRNQN